VRAAPKTIHPSRLADRDNDRPCQADLNGRHVNPTQKLSCSAVSAAGVEMMWRQPTQATAENVPVTRLTMKACVIAMARVARCFGERARLSLARATIDAIGPPTRQSRTSMRCRSRLSSLIISLTAEKISCDRLHCWWAFLLSASPQERARTNLASTKPGAVLPLAVRVNASIPPWRNARRSCAQSVATACQGSRHSLLTLHA
jgi:hypothetical protein